MAKRKHNSGKRGAMENLGQRMRGGLRLEKRQREGFEGWRTEQNREKQNWKAAG